ncbi:syntaxin-132-like [Raphanus sativus]|uniref:Syntaxin-132-like n=1 Tax=Raphanus sativus TaxID=3726 RepID=A0A6J0MYN2_RAPSA|nr:syntaxin-132-like [Raphanus sativus]
MKNTFNSVNRSLRVNPKEGSSSHVSCSQSPVSYPSEKLLGEEPVEETVNSERDSISVTGSFELPQGQSSREGDVELGEQGADQGLDDFFKKVQEIDKQYEKLNKLLKKLQKKMEKDVDEVRSIARFVKGKLEELDREKNSRKWMYIAIIIFLIVVAVIVVGVLKPWKDKKA